MSWHGEGFIYSSQGAWTNEIYDNKKWSLREGVVLYSGDFSPGVHSKGITLKQIWGRRDGNWKDTVLLRFWSAFMPHHFPLSSPRRPYTHPFSLCFKNSRPPTPIALLQHGQHKTKPGNKCLTASLHPWLGKQVSSVLPGPFSSIVTIWGQCSTIYSLPALFKFFFLKWRLARAH